MAMNFNPTLEILFWEGIRPIPQGDESDRCPDNYDHFLHIKFHQHLMHHHTFDFLPA